jgi:hypothetical protein
MSHHLTPRLLVQYLYYLYAVGDDVTILWLQERV